MNFVNVLKTCWVNEFSWDYDASIRKNLYVIRAFIVYDEEKSIHILKYYDIVDGSGNRLAIFYTYRAAEQYFEELISNFKIRNRSVPVYADE